MDHLTPALARSWILSTARLIEQNAQHLSDLDAAIGDGDHGANMSRGFQAVAKKLEGDAKADDLGALFKVTGMTLLSTVGGASGPLYGGFFLDLGKQCASRAALDAKDLADVLDSGLADIQRRGKAQPGDKTMVDALAPAIAAMRAAGDDIVTATRAAADAARNAATATAPLLARKGRASYLGERSIGHEDPGANSVALLLDALASATGA
ncbi:MAG: dihydroxyacetone kinase subunit L [Telmatospirillum sp.]|nr:dihydroxyacetone kinase subunit L [Telmatospirillum sp.]